MGKTGLAANAPAQCSSRKLRDSYMEAYASAIKGRCTNALGVRDFKKGLKPQKTCPSNTPYSSGYKAQRKRFCTSKVAKAKGIRGTRYDVNLCHVRQRKSLKKAYSEGKRIKGYKKAIVRLEKEIADLEDKLFSNKTPTDAKKHYREILTTKRSKLRSTERRLYKAESL